MYPPTLKVYGGQMIKLDTFKLQVVKKKRKASLTPNEYRILFLLHHLESVTGQELAKELETTPHQIKTHVCNLNDKLEVVGSKRLRTEPSGANVQYLVTENIRLVHKFS